jgi:hypothetical protein
MSLRDLHVRTGCRRTDNLWHEIPGKPGHLALYGVFIEQLPSRVRADTFLPVSTARGVPRAVPPGPCAIGILGRTNAVIKDIVRIGAGVNLIASTAFMDIGQSVLIIPGVRPSHRRSSHGDLAG